MISLKVYKRDKKNKFDDKKEIKAIVYGSGIKKNILISVYYRKFIKIFEEFGTSHIIELDIDGDKKDVLIKEFQLDPVTDNFRHIDFFVINSDTVIEVDVPLNFFGESPAIKLGHILTKVQMTLKIKCLPKNIPENIKIDMSILENIGDTIRLEDIKLPKEVSFVSEDMHETVVSISAPIEEKEEEDKKEDVDVIAEEKKDGGETVPNEK